MSACYLCGETRAVERWPRVRDTDQLRVLECEACGLVFLSSQDHISDAFYESGGIHEAGTDFERWSRETAADDDRRFAYCRALITNRRVLDFGCGNGGFLMRARAEAAAVHGVELEASVFPRLEHHGIGVSRSLGETSGNFDVITLFHVLEHLKDPRRTLRELAGRLTKDGSLVIEVPNADDALIRLYDVAAFKNFSYWSCHLYLFTAATLGRLVKQVMDADVRIEHVQRYPLSNHLYWLAHGCPGGHIHWNFLDDDGLTRAYAARLAALGATDTLLAQVRLRG